LQEITSKCQTAKIKEYTAIDQGLNSLQPDSLDIILLTSREMGHSATF